MSLQSASILSWVTVTFGGFPGGSDGEESACNAGDLSWIPGWDPLEKGIATHSSILPGEFHGQRSLVGYSLWGCEQLDTTEWPKLSLSTVTFILKYVCVFSSSIVSDSLQPMDYSLPGSSVHGILQARILEWVAISYSRGSSRPRGGTSLSCFSWIGRQIVYH